MSSAPKEHYYTPEEYLELERAAEFKSEYYNGEIYAMSGSSPQHSIISVNLIREISTHLRGKKCQPFDKDMKIGAKQSWFYYYPDASVICGEPTYRDNQQDVCTNPRVIFEVLSPSTEALDRGRKFLQYQRIESLTDYVLIAQDEARVEHFTKQKDGSWNLRIVSGLKSKLRIASIDCTLSLAELFDRIKFPNEKRPAKRSSSAKPTKKTG